MWLLRMRAPLVSILGWAGWITIAVGVCAIALGIPLPGDAVMTLIVLVFFLALLLRLAVQSWLQPRDRLAYLVLLAGILLWGAGSTLLGSAGNEGLSDFPNPSEGLFVATSLAFCAYLILDTRAHGSRVMATWLNTIVICGAGATLTSGVLLTPIGSAVPQEFSLFVALLFPILDLALALLVLGQLVLGARSWSPRAAGFIAGFLALAVADTSLVLNLESGKYQFTLGLDLIWGAAFLLIVDAAVRERRPVRVLDRKLSDAWLVGSFAIALFMLAIRPQGELGWAVGVPAAITLLAVIARLAVALRDSKAAAEAFRLALTDDLTGLPNRRAMLRALEGVLDTDDAVGFLLLDLDAFKEVNDTLGHAVGDEMLEMFGRRLRDVVPPSTLVARMGGDEFAIMAPTNDELELMELSRTIRDSFDDPVRVSGIDITMHASIGITAREPADKTPVDLFRRADIAMYQAKNDRTGAQMYISERDEFSRQRLRVGSDLRRALDVGEIELRYQPKIETGTWATVGVEALVRWQHPEFGLLSPIGFLADARRTGMMNDITLEVIRQTLEAADRWHRSSLDLGVAINIAPPELLGSQFLKNFFSLANDVRVPRNLVTIEVTEDAFMSEPEQARDVIVELHEQGFRTSIDDYGTGFSSLAYLRDLPVSEIKLDRTFVAAVLVDPSSRLIVESTISMAHALGLKVVAEGVESAAVAEVLVQLGTDILQGYHFAAPMERDAVVPWLMSTNRISQRPGPA
ncbi:MAG: bifunctional diguanylate cyclase/phosphodiesterase [Candidatus Nanopelagicales bacterium]|nr:bifunctional diguanylate cyclase/phosphodiesterase [Candidatus Nanopelagicales bacterium]